MTKIGRIDIIAQNGNDGLHYKTGILECWGEFDKFGDCLCKMCKHKKSCKQTTDFLNKAETYFERKTE